MTNKEKEVSRLWDIGFTTIQELETAEGILASGKEEIYGCVFGRDCLITSLKLLKVYKKTKNEYFRKLVRKVLINLGNLQGKEVNIESGEQPGKCIHEYRTDNHEHLTKNSENPWYVYEDGSMRNYDTVDATPLFLVTVYEFYKTTGDEEFLKTVEPNVLSSLDWMLNFGDSNQDNFIDYEFDPKRKFGGLKTQSWMDSVESTFHEDGSKVVYPIAPVEVQSYSFSSYLLWGRHYENSDPTLSKLLLQKAQDLKKSFNEKFVTSEGNNFNIAFAIDGNAKPLTSPRSSMGHCLWTVIELENGTKESILDANLIPALAKRLLQPDLFETNAGIRTLSKNSKFYSANSYHNGSIWPHDTSIIISGLENFGYKEEAGLLRSALLSAYEHFQTPIELFVFDEGKFNDYNGVNGQKSCKKQAWSAASLLSIL